MHLLPSPRARIACAATRRMRTLQGRASCAPGRAPAASDVVAAVQVLHGTPLALGPSRIDGPSIEHTAQGKRIMLGWTLTFLFFALIAALFGFTGIAASFAGIAKILFVVLLVLLVLTFIFGKRRVVA